jgi:zinc and cadmium transporter
MLPSAAESLGSPLAVYLWFIRGFVTFYVLEQYLHWHHCHRGAECERQPLGTLILVADGLHNLIGGLAVGASFLLATPVGMSAWVAAAAHEVPQELGAFGVLVHSGWGPRRALFFNLLSAPDLPRRGACRLRGRWCSRGHLLGPVRRRQLRLHRRDRSIPQLTVTESWREKLVHTLALFAGLGLLLVTALGR